MDLTEGQQLAHNLTNKLMSMQGKILKLKMMTSDETKEEVLKLESYCQESMNLLREVKTYLDND